MLSIQSSELPAAVVEKPKCCFSTEAGLCNESSRLFVVRGCPEAALLHEVVLHTAQIYKAYRLSTFT